VFNNASKRMRPLPGSQGSNSKIPGWDPEDMDISLVNDVLTIRGRRDRKKRRRRIGRPAKTVFPGINHSGDSHEMLSLQWNDVRRKVLWSGGPFLGMEMCSLWRNYRSLNFREQRVWPKSRNGRKQRDAGSEEELKTLGYSIRGRGGLYRQPGQRDGVREDFFGN
jgi:hypothetical protein